MPDSDPDHSPESYLELLNAHGKSLAAYVYTLVVDRNDAEDILQACRLTMWKKFGDFEPGTNFLAWARKIALHQILNYRRSEKRNPVYSSDPAFIESVAEEIDRQSDSLAARSEALRFCLRRLPKNQRHTVLLRYYEDCGIAEIARQTNRTEGAVYRLLSRIRGALNECINRQLETTS
ncbi:MAG: sigma-70 family RNA polymerase sigma factor [Verrucomicrobiales bacterium]